MAETQSDAGAIERRDDSPEDQAKRAAAAFKFWQREMGLADEAEKDFREEGEKIIRRYRGEKEYKAERFRLLYSNVSIMAPALFNSLPVADIRRRFNDRDEDARQVAQSLERAIGCQAEKSDFEAVMDEIVLHRLLPGRGVARVRYEPHFAPATDPATGKPAMDDQGKPVEELVNESVNFEVVPWKDFRRGPGKRWSDVPWVGFRIYPKLQDLEKLAPAIAKDVPLDAQAGEPHDDKDGAPAADAFKRAEVWQIWDREKGEIVYWAPRYSNSVLATRPDELKLEGFFPTPEPLMAMRSPDDLRPVSDWSQYALLADELEEITKRLRRLVAAAKWRGVTAKELGGAFDKMNKLADGQLAPAEDAITFAQEGGIKNAIFLMPLAELMAAIKQLYEAREQTKQVIFEVTGLADVLRGSTNPNETLGAQRLKAQWGSLRLQKSQSDVQRYCRDLYRLGVEIIATRFDPKSIMLASGISLTPQQIQLMQRDLLREYRIDIETDSTIRADLGRQQENIGQFVQGFGTFMQALTPAVASGQMMADEAADLLTGFARSFKLGRQGEEALERMGDRLREQAALAKKQGAAGGQPPPDPKVIEAQIEQQRQQGEIAHMERKAQIELQQDEVKLQMQERALALKEREAQLRMLEADANHRFTMEQTQASIFAAAQKHEHDMAKLAASQSVGVPMIGARQ